MNAATPITIEVNGRLINTSGFQLLQWKHALKLEAQGLKLSRGRSVSAHCKKLFGIPRNERIAVVAEIVADIHDQVSAKLGETSHG